MGKILLKNGVVVNEGIIQENDVLIQDDIILKIGKDISDTDAKVIDIKGLHVLPGIIDDQVHF